MVWYLPQAEPVLQRPEVQHWRLLLLVQPQRWQALVGLRAAEQLRPLQQRQGAGALPLVLLLQLPLQGVLLPVQPWRWRRQLQPHRQLVVPQGWLRRPCRQALAGRRAGLGERWVVLWWRLAG